jgi:pimeloyl-ACP methyl ester carboxylesterase
MARVFSTADFIYHAPSNGQPHVVVLPGLVAGKWMWEPTLQVLERAGYGYLTLVEPLARGHDCAAPITEAVIDLIDRCGIESTAIIGGSFGSRIALDCALALPDRVRMVALSGAPGSVTAGFLGVSFQGKVTSSVVAALVDRVFYNSATAPKSELDAMLELFRDQRYTINAVRLMRESSGYDYAGVLTRIASPLLMIWGVHDFISPCPLWESTLAPHASKGSFFKIQRCGHVPMIERPNVFNALLLDRLSAAIA